MQEEFQIGNVGVKCNDREGERKKWLLGKFLIGANIENKKGKNKTQERKGERGRLRREKKECFD